MSTIKTIQYNNPANFTYDSGEVLIDGAEAKLIPLVLQPNEMMVVTGANQVDADRAIDSNVTVRLGNGATRDVAGREFLLSGSAYLSLNDDSGREPINPNITPLTPTSQFHFGAEGTVRFKVAFNYAGTPASDNHLFSTGDSTTSLGLGSVISVYHKTDGNLYLNIRDNLATSSPELSLGAFAPVASQYYEFELNTSQNTGATRLFIDGVLQALSSSKVTAVTRDYFYFGTNYREDQGASDIIVKDIQIINGVTHTANFASEIPRIVGVYPTESKVQPLEYSIAEGFESITPTFTAVGASAVDYLLLVESTYYWIDGGVLSTSDESLAESNLAAEWNDPLVIDQINTLIASGARITLVPILSSGDRGADQIVLTSDTTLYNFFSVLVDCITCTLYGIIKDNCADIASGTVRVYTKKPILTQGTLINIDETLDIALTDGVFEFDLVIPNFLVAGLSPVANGNSDIYKLEANWIDSDSKSWKYKADLLIPNQSTVSLTDAIV